MKIKKQCPVKIEGIESYRGNSGNCYHTIINRIPPHNTLVVPFLGNCAITRHIRQAHQTIGNDLSTNVYEKWKAMEFNWIELHNLDFMQFLSSLNFSHLGKTTLYVDPPYSKATWACRKNMNEHKMIEAQYVQLLDFLLALPKGVDVILTTLPNKLYSDKLKGWHTEKFTNYTHRRQQIQQLFCNYPLPLTSLHDYSYCGEDFRERERIKKKIERETKSLLKRPLIEQRAILTRVFQNIETNASTDERQVQAATTIAIEYYRS